MTTESYAMKAKEESRRQKMKQQRKRDAELRAVAARSLPTIPKDKHTVAKSYDWNHTKIYSIDLFQRKLNAAVKAARRSGANRISICFYRFELIGYGLESDTEFEKRKRDVVKQRGEILAAREAVKELNKKEREALTSARKMLTKAARTLTVDEFEQLVKDVSCKLKE